MFTPYGRRIWAGQALRAGSRPDKRLPAGLRIQEQYRSSGSREIFRPLRSLPG